MREYLTPKIPESGRTPYYWLSSQKGAVMLYKERTSGIPLHAVGQILLSYRYHDMDGVVLIGTF